MAIGTGLPMRELAHLRRLFAERLERLEPGLGFERLTLEAWATDPMAGSQGSFGVGVGMGRVQDGEALAQLFDRLSQRVRVQRLAPAASHWPEYAVRALVPHALVPAPPPGWGTQPAPVLLLRRPHQLAVVAAVPDGPPALLRWQRRVHRIRRAEGPLRLEPEWWRDSPGRLRRDYYQVELASGMRLWIYRTADRWLLHGHLP